MIISHKGLLYHHEEGRPDLFIEGADIERGAADGTVWRLRLQGGEEVWETTTNAENDAYLKALAPYPSNIKTHEISVYTTTDGREFDRYHKAQAHQAELAIRQMLTDADCVGVEQDTVMAMFHAIGIYVPPSLWEDLRK